VIDEILHAAAESRYDFRRVFPCVMARSGVTFPVRFCAVVEVEVT
jgi:hypothetical protein